MKNLKKVMGFGLIALSMGTMIQANDEGMKASDPTDTISEVHQRKVAQVENQIQYQGDDYEGVGMEALAQVEIPEMECLSCDMKTFLYDVTLGLVFLNDYVIGFPLVCLTDVSSELAVLSTLLHANSLVFPIIDANGRNLCPAPLSYWKDPEYFSLRASIRLVKLGASIGYMAGQGDMFFYANLIATGINAMSGIGTLGTHFGFFSSFK